MRTDLRMYSSTPTVFDKMVQLFVIDKDGKRHSVRALEGQNVAQALLEYGHLDRHSFMPNPFDSSYFDCHVYVAYDYLKKLPALTTGEKQEEKRILEDYARHRQRDNSRMGKYITLSRDLSGLTVALGEIEPWQMC